MSRLFGDYPDALRNTAVLAERCAGAVKLDGQLHMPSARLPEGVSAGRRLVELAVKGVREKYRGSTEDPSRIKARLRRELSCIQELGFAPYFLIAQEAAQIARSKGIPVTGRGSAANSLVCYAIGLTQPEPFSNRLLFERFMHEGRKGRSGHRPGFLLLAKGRGDSEPLDGPIQGVRGRRGRHGRYQQPQGGDPDRRPRSRLFAERDRRLLEERSDPASGIGTRWWIP